MGLDELRVGVHPGTGVVGRFKGALVLVTVDPDSPSVDDLLDACRSTAGAADRLRAIGQQPGSPPFCALLDTKDGILVLIAGAMAFNAVMAGRRVELESTDTANWTEERLKGKPLSIAFGTTAFKLGASPLLDLMSGVVLGSAVELVSRAEVGTATPAAARTPAPATAPVAGAAPPAAAKDARAADDVVPSTVLMEQPVEAVAERESAIAGKTFDDDRMLDAVPAAKKGQRDGAAKPLGRLVGGGGINVLVDRTLIVGRHPAEAPEVAAGTATAVGTPLDDTRVSRVHAEVRVDGSNIFLVDRNSANGTYVKPPGTDEWIRLEPGHGVMIVPGTAIMIGAIEVKLEA